MTLRKRIIASQAELQLAAGRIDRDFERFASLDTDGDMRRAHNLHMDGLRDAWRILNEVGVVVDDIEALLKLQTHDPKAFDAIMVLVRIELERPAPAETKVAA
jgi:hypothetical protein